jgi:hypothetical protein
MTEGSGDQLRDWRRSRGWDVPELARQLRRAAEEPIAAHDGLLRMIRGWERGDHRLSERYELLYRRLGRPNLLRSRLRSPLWRATSVAPGRTTRRAATPS